MAGCSGCAKRAKEAAARAPKGGKRSGPFDPALYGDPTGNSAKRQISLSAGPPPADQKG